MTHYIEQKQMWSIWKIEGSEWDLHSCLIGHAAQERLSDFLSYKSM